MTSILEQDFADFELIIADNASEDETESICRELMRSDARIKYHRNEVNIGASANYNKLFHLATGKYFKWQAYDDECHRAMIRRCVQALEAAPASVVMVYPRAELIDAVGKTLRSPLDRIASLDARPHRRLARLISSLNMCDPFFGVMKAEQLRKTRLLGPFFGADNVLLAELAMLGQIREIDEVLFRLRAHEKRSMKVNVTARAREAWYDPSAVHRRFVLPSWERMILELLRSVARSPLSPVEKVKCSVIVPAIHYYRRLRNAGGRWKARYSWHSRNYRRCLR